MAGRKTTSVDLQQRLPFEAAQGSHDERRNRLGIAIKLADGDLHLREFVMWVFNATHGGLPGERLYKSYSELAASPWGLCCSPGKARTTAYRAQDLGIVSGQEERAQHTGSQKPNSYAIDWEGVTRFLGFANRRSRLPADATTAHPPATTAHPPATTAQHIKETPVFNPSLQAGQARRVANEISTAAGASAGRWDTSARVRVREAFAAVGIKRVDNLLDEAEITLKLSAAEVVAVCDEFAGNREVLNGPGAIAYRLRAGCWPTEGVKPAAKLHALAAEQHRDSLVAELRALLRAARSQNIIEPSAQKAYLRARLPLAFCESEGW